jgi:hypothetical protein
MKIKFLLILLSSLLLIQLGSCFKKKNFEGSITYINQFTTLNKNMTKEHLISKFGDTVIVHIKDGYYKHLYNSTSRDGIREITYIPRLNRAYMRLGESDTTIWFSCDNTPRKLYNTKTNNNAIKVLGKNCNEVIFESAYESDEMVYNISTHFYYSPDYLKINKETFELHGESYLNKYFEYAEAMYLQYKYIEHEAFERKQIAIDIKEQKLDISLFNIDSAKSRSFYY